MNKLKFRCIILFALAISCQVAANAQLPKIDPNGLKRTVVVTDRNFEPQKSVSVASVRPQILYEVWITTDGILHCKTSSTLKSASIYFTPPTVTTAPDANGNSTGTGGGYSRKYELNKPAAGDEYIFNLASDKYKEKHAITLSVTSTSGAKADIKLINKKVPAEIKNDVP